MILIQARESNKRFLKLDRVDPCDPDGHDIQPIVRSLPSVLCWKAVGHLEAHGGHVGHEEGVVGGGHGDAGHPSQGHRAQVRRDHHHCCCRDEALAILQTAGSCSETRECFAQLLAAASWLSGGVGRSQPSTLRLLATSSFSH